MTSLSLATTQQEVISSKKQSTSPVRSILDRYDLAAALSDQRPNEEPGGDGAGYPSEELMDQITVMQERLLNEACHLRAVRLDEVLSKLLLWNRAYGEDALPLEAELIRSAIADLSSLAGGAG